MCETVDTNQGEPKLKIMKKATKSATTMMWVEYWVEHVNPSQDMFEIWTDELPNGKWKCEIELPLINQTVKSISATQVNAMKNASDKAAKLINAYMSEHPELKIRNMFKGQEWIFTEDENGRFKCAGRSPRMRAREGKQLQFIMTESSKAMEKAILRIKKVNGSVKNLFVQAIDKSFFKENDSIEDMQRKIRNKMLGDSSDWYISWISTSIVENCIVAVGYIWED